MTPLAFYAFASVVICFHVVAEPQVRADTLLGAVCGYLMLGYTWAVAYATLIASSPDAFHSSARDGAALQGDALYFSFVTLTTLGYGDIVPLTAQARSLVILESVTGVLYLAVLVSRLVAMYTTASHDRV
jgi:hypothetical protein